MCINVAKAQMDEEYVDHEKMYSRDVRMYLKRHSDTFLNDFVILCEKTNGRISYESMLQLLGDDMPIASWIEAKDRKQQIVQFFKEIGIFFRFDSSHLYFP